MSEGRVPSPPPGAEASYPYVFTVQPRWTDFDALGHLNNATYVTYVELARVAFYDQVLGGRRPDCTWVVAETRCRYLRQVPIGEPSTVYLRVQRMGTSSLVFAFLLTSGPDGSRSAEGEVVQVVVDVASGRPRPIPDDWRAKLEGYRGSGD